MEKLLLVLASLLMVSPAMADVTITAVDEGAGLVSINYAATGADADGLYSLISGMAINVSLTAGTMDIVPGSYKDDGESTNASPGYGIYPGSMVFDVNQQVTSYGDPVAPGTDPGALGDLPGSACTLELGALYDDEAVPSAQPLASGTICQLQVSECTDVVLAIESTHRKGIVREDGSVPSNVILLGAMDVSCCCCWCYDCFEKGDANADCQITFSDVSVVINAWPPNPYDSCADFTKDGSITFSDVSVLINSWPPKPNCDVSCVPMPDDLVGATEVSSEPPCWSYDCFESGDGTGDCSITFGDVSPLISGWPPNMYNPCADYNKDGQITFSDVAIVIAHWPPNPGCDPGCVPIP